MFPSISCIINGFDMLYGDSPTMYHIQAIRFFAFFDNLVFGWI